MKSFKYITLLIALFMMNIMYAELKTFGMPSDEETEQIPSNEAPNEETPNGGEEEAPSDGEEGEEEAPSDGEEEKEEEEEEEEMPTAAEDSTVSEDQPIKFKEEYVISANLGGILFTGANISDSFDNGLNINLKVSTPFQFNLANRSISVDASMSMLSMSTKGAWEDYKPTLLGLNLNTDLFSGMSLSFGTGLALASGTTVGSPNASTNEIEDYSMTTLYISGGFSYELPLSSLLSGKGNLENLRMSLHLNGAEIFGAPAESGTSDILSFGLSVGYPILL